MGERSFGELLCRALDLGLASPAHGTGHTQACLDPLPRYKLPTRMLKGPAFSGHPGDCGL